MPNHDMSTPHACLTNSTMSGWGLSSNFAPAGLQSGWGERVTEQGLQALYRGQVLQRATGLQLDAVDHSLSGGLFKKGGR